MALLKVYSKLITLKMLEWMSSLVEGLNQKVVFDKT